MNEGQAKVILDVIAQVRRLQNRWPGDLEVYEIMVELTWLGAEWIAEESRRHRGDVTDADLSKLRERPLPQCTVVLEEIERLWSLLSPAERQRFRKKDGSA